MRKSLLAAALLGAFAAQAALADDSTVTVYGKVNEGFRFDRTAAPTAADKFATITQNVVGNGGLGLNTPSRIGFKGVEDLGGGEKAWFQIETGIGADDAATSNFANREGWVGLQGGWGKLGLGRGKTPYTNLADRFDGLVDGGDNLAVYKDGTLDLANPWLGGSNTAVTSNRFNNAVRYDSPNLEGVTLTAMYGAGENKTAAVSSSSNISLGANYANGPFFIGTADNFENHIGGVNDRKNTALLVIGNYSIDALTLGAGYQYAKAETTDAKFDRSYWMLDATYKIGDFLLKTGAIVAQKAHANVGTSNAGAAANGILNGDLAYSDYVRYTLGATYNLSKRTYTYVEYTADDNKNGKYVNSLGATVTTGHADISSVGIGIVHNF